MNTDAAQVDERVAGAELLDRVFLVLEAVVAEVAVAVVMVSFRPVRMAAAVADGDDDHTDLGETVDAGHAPGPGYVVGLDLRARIDVISYRIDLCRIEIEWLVHYAVKVCDCETA